jgi:hypothetical protein
MTENGTENSMVEGFMNFLRRIFIADSSPKKNTIKFDNAFAISLIEKQIMEYVWNNSRKELNAYTKQNRDNIYNRNFILDNCGETHINNLTKLYTEKHYPTIHNLNYYPWMVFTICAAITRYHRIITIGPLAVILAINREEQIFTEYCKYLTSIYIYNRMLQERRESYGRFTEITIDNGLICT